jgi:hypothetical protein
MNDNNDAQNVKDWHDSAGRFRKSNPGKPKGSTKNKLRDKIKSFIGDNWENFGTWFQKLKEKEKIDVMLALMPYAVARLQSMAVTDSDGNDLEPRASYDYTKLSASALKELLSITEIRDNGNHE